MRRLRLLILLTLLIVIGGRPGFAADILITTEATLDAFNNSHAIYLSKNTDTLLNKISYLPGGTTEAKTIFLSHDKIIDLSYKTNNNNLMASWKTEYGDRRDSSLAISLDGGNNFSQPRQASAEVNWPALAQPHIVATNWGKIRYAPNNSDPLLCRLEVSPRQDFPAGDTWLFEQLLAPVSREVYDYQIPVTLPDGKYFARLSASDGLQTSPPGRAVGFIIDSIPPTLVSLEADRRRDKITYSGQVSETPFWLKVNDQPVSYESGSSFTASFKLNAARNAFTFSLSDEAGNTSVATREFYFNPASPEVTILQPADNVWLKESTTLLLVADVFDLQGDIAEECPTKVMLEGTLLDSSLSYDSEQQQLSGLINLPPLLAEGKHLAYLTVADQSHNLGTASFSVNIDSTPPLINLTDQSCFVNSAKNLVIPLSDAGAGVDPAGTLITIVGVSLEGRATNESGALVVSSRSILSEGSFEAAVTPRDLVGNLAGNTRFTLIVDTTSPRLQLLGTPETETASREIIITGLISDKYLGKVTIYDNDRRLESFTPAQAYFERHVQLTSGRNDLKIEAEDKAGNKTAQALTVNVNNFGATALIASLANGPNPFKPSSQTHYFIYNLNAPSDVRVYIFDLSGDRLWTKSAAGTAAGSITWDGRDSFGRNVGNGVYPFVFSVSSGGGSELKRGQVIVLQ